MTHFKLTDFHADNYHLYVEKPEAGFSAEKNYEVINQTIEEYEKMRYSVDGTVQENAATAADILSSWAKYKLDYGGGKQMEEWFGKENLSRIYGEKLLDKIAQMEQIKKENRDKGNTKFENYYLS